VPHAPASALDWLVLAVEGGILLAIVRALMLLGEIRLKVNTMWDWWIEYKAHTEPHT